MSEHPLSPRNSRTTADLPHGSLATLQFAADVIAKNQRLTTTGLLAAASQAADRIPKPTGAAAVAARIQKSYQPSAFDRLAKFAAAIPVYQMDPGTRSLLDSLKRYQPPAAALAASQTTMMRLVEEINRKHAPILKQLSQFQAVSKVIDSNFELTRARQDLAVRILENLPVLPVEGAAEATRVSAVRGSHQRPLGEYAAAFFVLYSYVRDVFKTAGEHDTFMAHVLTATLLATLYVALELAP